MHFRYCGADSTMLLEEIDSKNQCRECHAVDHIPDPVPHHSACEISDRSEVLLRSSILSSLLTGKDLRATLPYAQACRHAYACIHHSYEAGVARTSLTHALRQASAVA